MIGSGLVAAGPAPAAAGPARGWHDFDDGTVVFEEESVPYDQDGVLELTNRVRRAHGCGNRLRHNHALANAAFYHSRDMAVSRYFSHRSRDRSQPDDRIQWAGYNPSNGWAENIAYGYGTAYSVVRAWMHSPGHRRNILNCSFRSLGVGVARAGDGTLFWTQNFGGR